MIPARRTAPVFSRQDVEVIVGEGLEPHALPVELVRTTALIALRTELGEPARSGATAPDIPTAPTAGTSAAGKAVLNVLLTDDPTLRRLNRQFAGEDKTTDVLAFGAGQNFPGDDQDASAIGDIAISVPQAARQAEAAGHRPERELALLTAHGVLHLLGYDHAEPDEEKVMFSKTGLILKQALTISPPQ